MKRTLPSSTTTLPAGFQDVVGGEVSSDTEADPEGSGSCGILGDGPAEEGVANVVGERVAAVPGGVVSLPVVAYCFSRASHLASLSCKSWFGLLRLRAGAGVEGVHVTLA